MVIVFKNKNKIRLQRASTVVLEVARVTGAAYSGKLCLKESMCDRRQYSYFYFNIIVLSGKKGAHII